jgi:hypothetical protein
MLISGILVILLIAGAVMYWLYTDDETPEGNLKRNFNTFIKKY